MADTGGPSYEPGLEARVSRLESDVAHMREDIAEIKATLDRLAPRIDELHGFLNAVLPTLATKADLADLRAELKSEVADLRAELKSEIADLRLLIMQRPTHRQTVYDIFAIVGLIGTGLATATRLIH